MKKGVMAGFAVFLLVLALGLAACGRRAERTEVTKAVAVLHPTEGSKVTGFVSFEKVRGGIRVTATVEGLSPGLHGFHVHEFGDCTSPDGNSAGGHFNPMGAQHGGPTADGRHVGDLGNIDAGKGDGPVKYETVDKMLALEGPNSIIGRSVVVHAKADDLKTQPTGNSGARLACGVIGITK